MGANDEFPRGLALTSGRAAFAGVTFPAVSGISWVLTEVEAAWLVTTAYAGDLYFTIAVNGSELDMNGSPEPHAVGDGGRLSWSGSLAFPPGIAVNPSFESGNGVGYQILTAKAYPI